MYRLAWLLAIGAFCSGCSIIEAGAHTLVIEPLHYCNIGDKYVSHMRHERMAEIAWQQFLRSHGDQGFSEDYGHGFRDGFADYLNAGGTGEPPPVPPRHYWKAKYQSPQGYQAIQDWYAGFRHGAEVAMASGWRQFIVIPTSSLSGVTQDPASYTPPPVPKDELIETPPLVPPNREVLPPPDHASVSQAEHLTPWSVGACKPPLVEQLFATAPVPSVQTPDPQQKSPAAFAVATAPLSQHPAAAAGKSETAAPLVGGELPHGQNRILPKRLPAVPAAGPQKLTN